MERWLSSEPFSGVEDGVPGWSLDFYTVGWEGAAQTASIHTVRTSIRVGQVNDLAFVSAARNRANRDPGGIGVPEERRGTRDFFDMGSAQRRWRWRGCHLELGVFRPDGEACR